jgi:hypothetical protein
LYDHPPNQSAEEEVRTSILYRARSLEMLLLLLQSRRPFKKRRSCLDQAQHRREEVKNGKPLTDAEKIALLMDKLIDAQNCLLLATKGELPPHIAELCYKSVNNAYRRLTENEQP